MLPDKSVADQEVACGLSCAFLPLQASGFVGRERERSEAKALLTTNRMLTGPGRCGKTRLALEVASGLADGFRGGAFWVELEPEDVPSPVTELRAHKVEVLGLVAEGFTDHQIANSLYLSPRTVWHHLRNIYRKFGVRSRAAATRAAIERGLI